MTADALTVAPSKAELQVAYYRKTIIAALPVLLAALNVVRDAAQTSDGLNASTIVLAVLAAAGAVGVYLPSNARAKLIASGVLAIGSGVTAAVTDGISSASLLVVATQLVAWAAAGAVANGPAPAVAIAAADGSYPISTLPVRPVPEKPLFDDAGEQLPTRVSAHRRAHRVARRTSWWGWTISVLLWLAVITMVWRVALAWR